MLFIHSFLFCIFIFTTSFFYNVSALKLEGLIGGYPSYDPDTFKYQVAIVMKENNSRELSLVCGGGIIAPTLILTAAQCFFEISRAMKEYTFSVIVNSTYLNGRDSIIVDIIYIYIPDFHIARYFTISTNDIAIAEVTHNLFLLPDCNLHSLQVPTTYGQSYGGKLAVVAGYGDDHIYVEPHPLSGDPIRALGRSQHLLRYANVSVLTDAQCYRKFYPRIKLPIDHLMCGVMRTNSRFDWWGICANDLGAPLVFNNTIVGIACELTPDCNDTRTGALYTKTSTFTYFLNQVMQHVNSGSELGPGVLVYDNPTHVMEYK